jgi:hypothetical protein
MNLLRKLTPFLIGLAAGLLLLAPLAPRARCAGMGAGMTSGSSGRGVMRGGGDYGFSSVGSALIIDAYPLEAQVFLDGRLLGTGRETWRISSKTIPASSWPSVRRVSSLNPVSTGSTSSPSFPRTRRRQGFRAG